ncbi:PD-(D/E)XK motif protein [Paraburkholderia mimosarum]|uniref:PD-(D/E)XK motif protein n=1 Tax=Paraburkholderia mimosarum TaxID=312026 RepID=UPI0039C18A68
MSGDITFEELRLSLEGLAQPARADERSVFWIFPKVLGLAKTSSGRVEIFIGGPKLHPRTPIVRRHLEHGRWAITESADEFDASRIVLPSQPHFIAVAALLGVELVQAGIGKPRPLQDVLDEVEPLLELALLRSALSEEFILGLMGELLCLESLLDAVAGRPDARLAILDMWHGHQVGQRDFVVGSTSIEIKTTQLESSTHSISGVHQVEIDERLPSEKRLLLLSVGLTQAQQEGRTLPEIVQRILAQLGPDTGSGATMEFTPLQQRFLDDVYRYGGAGSRGYDHRTDSASKAYSTRYKTTFTPRLYDLTDEDVLILRRRNVDGLFVRPDSVQYTLDLPSVINGRNPAANWKQTVSDLVRSHQNVAS